MFFIEDFCKFTSDQEWVVNAVVNPEGSFFPFYLSRSTRSYKAFTHAMLDRSESSFSDGGNRVISTYYSTFHDIFMSFCDKNNIKVKKILRAAVNYSIYYKGLVCEPHVDHDFDHCNFLLYLTNCTGGDTLIYDKEGNIIKSISPIRSRAVVFSGDKHSIAEFEPGEDRIVVVFTFIKE